jgi:CrcB protein
VHWDVLAVIFAGGCLGGWARYAATTAWPAPLGRFPWATFVVNTTGAFVLAVVVVAAAELAAAGIIAARFLRPVLGTGFCGAFTTFSSIVVTVDQLAAHRHAALAGGYLAASLSAGLVAAVAGLALARAVAGGRGPDAATPC